MAFTVGGFAFNQCNCNKILAVAYVLYALQMIGMPAAFMKHYFSEKSVDESPDMLKFFTMMYGILFITGGYISWTFCDGFGMSFYNLFGQCLFAVHFVALLFGNLYAEKLYADEKQMWQIQLGINIIFVAIAYSGYTDAVACGKKDSDKTHNEAETSHKVISGVALHQTNVNKFFGVCWGFYGIMMLAMTEKFMLQYFTEDAIDFKLFMFFARGLGLQMITLSATNWLHPGSDAMSFANVALNALFLLHFIAIMFGHIYDDALYEPKKNMWYVQMLVNVFFLTVAYLGFKDSKERLPAAATAAATAAPAAAAAAAAPADAPAEPEGGSML